MRGMFYWLLSVVTLLFVFASTSYSGDKPDSSTLKAIHAGVLEARSKLRNASFLVTATCPVAKRSYQGYQGATRQYTVSVFDAKGFRKFEMQMQHPAARWTAKTLLRGTEIFLEPGEYAPHADVGSLRGPYNLERFVFDPLSLGLVCRPVLEMQQLSLEASLAPMVGAPEFSIKEGLNGAVVIACHFSKGEIQYEVQPQQGYSVTRVERRNSGSDYVQLVETRYAVADSASDDGTVWYPAAVTYREMQATEVLFQEDLRIKLTSHNHLTESDFELATLGLAEGRKILHEDSRLSVWDKGRMRRVSSSDVYDKSTHRYITVGNNANRHLHVTSDSALSTGSARRMLIVANLAIAAVTCMFLLLRSFSRRRKQRSQSVGGRP